MSLDFGFLAAKTPGFIIDIFDPETKGGDHYRESAADCARVLEGLDRYLAEYEETIFPCSCVRDDGDYGVYESDTGAYTHHPDCMQGSYYHYHVFLVGIANYLRSINLKEVRA